MTAKPKLSIVEVAAIRQAHQPMSVVGKRYGVSRQTIWMIRSGRTWKTAANDNADPLLVALKRAA
jgi:hypothetical protein